jgi:hypothetical protein
VSITNSDDWRGQQHLDSSASDLRVISAGGFQNNPDLLE